MLPPFLEIMQNFIGFLIVGGGMGGPPTDFTGFFQPLPPLQTNAPNGAHPHLKVKPPHLKNKPPIEK